MTILSGSGLICANLGPLYKTNLKNNLLSWHELIYDSDWMIYWPIKSDSRISNNVCYNEWDSNNCMFESGIRWILRKYARWFSNVFWLARLSRSLIGQKLFTELNAKQEETMEMEKGILDEFNVNGEFLIEFPNYDG